MRIAASVCVLGVACGGVSTRAGVIATDSFAYPNGNLWGSAGGTGAWSSIWTGNGMAVSAERAVGDNVGNPPKYGSRPFNNPVATTEFFVAFDLTAPVFAPGDYFGVLLSSGVNNGILTVAKDVGSNDFRVGNSSFSATGIVIQPGVTYRVVAASVFAHGPVPASQLVWINPTAADYYDPATGASSADAVRHEGVFFGPATVTMYTGIPGVAFDNLVMGDAPADVGLASAAPSCAGDINGDGFTNAADFTILAGNFGSSVPPNTGGDLNGDGVVNAADFVILAGDFGCGN